MGSALETLCGQAAGAGQSQMLGTYMQRSWIICGVTALVLTPVYVFTSPMLKLLHQSEDISDVVGKYTRWAIPQLFAYAMNFPLQKFYQSQSKVWVMTAIAGVGLAIHALLYWFLLRSSVTAYSVRRWLEMSHGGLLTWLICLFGFRLFPETWTGFSLATFKYLAAFVKLSLASAVMLCLEPWYYTAVIIMVGLLKNPEIQVGAISICMNYQLWTLMVALGFNAVVSARVSNELGANHPKAAKFSVIIAVSTSAFIGLIVMIIVLVERKQLPKFFTDVPELIREISKLGYLLGATIFIGWFFIS